LFNGSIVGEMEDGWMDGWEGRDTGTMTDFLKPLKNHLYRFASCPHNVQRKL